MRKRSLKDLVPFSEKTSGKKGCLLLLVLALLFLIRPTELPAQEGWYSATIINNTRVEVALAEACMDRASLSIESVNESCYSIGFVYPQEEGPSETQVQFGRRPSDGVYFVPYVYVWNTPKGISMRSIRLRPGARIYLSDVL